MPEQLSININKNRRIFRRKVSTTCVWRVHRIWTIFHFRYSQWQNPVDCFSERGSYIRWIQPPRCDPITLQFSCSLCPPLCVSLSLSLSLSLCSFSICSLSTHHTASASFVCFSDPIQCSEYVSIRVSSISFLSEFREFPWKSQRSPNTSVPVLVTIITHLLRVTNLQLGRLPKVILLLAEGSGIECVDIYNRILINRFSIWNALQESRV